MVFGIIATKGQNVSGVQNVPTKVGLFRCGRNSLEEARGETLSLSFEGLTLSNNLNRNLIPEPFMKFPTKLFGWGSTWRDSRVLIKGRLKTSARFSSWAL
ncbi:unnamed protein product, partial [Tenebrio molitor]